MASEITTWQDVGLEVAKQLGDIVKIGGAVLIAWFSLRRLILENTKKTEAAAKAGALATKAIADSMIATQQHLNGTPPDDLDIKAIEVKKEANRIIADVVPGPQGG